MSDRELARLTKHFERFPTIPSVALRIFRELEDPDFELRRVAELVAQDPVLAARIVRISRSPIFGGRGGDSVEQAIMRLGASQTRDVVLTVGVMDTVPQLPEPLNVVSFWSLGLGTALSARRLAEDLKYPHPAKAYLGGLVHLLGEAYLAIEFSERYASAAQGAIASGRPIEACVTGEFGASPAEVTGALLRSWSFDEEVVEAVESHSDPVRAREHGLLSEILFAGDRICRDLRIGPRDPEHEGRPWVEDLSDEMNVRIQSLGYPDLTFYLIDQREFLQFVEESTRTAFSG